VTEHTHTLFEEMLSLRIAGDVVMALCQETREPKPDYRIKLPLGFEINANLIGHIEIIRPRRPEIIQRLTGQDII